MKFFIDARRGKLGNGAEGEHRKNMMENHKDVGKKYI